MIAAPTAPTTVPLTGGRYTLLGLETPVESFSHWLDQFLIRYLPGDPSLVAALRVLISLLLTVLAAWLAGWMCRRLGLWAARSGNKLAASLLEVATPTLRWMVLLAGLSDTIEDAWPAQHGPVRWVAGTLFVLSAVVAMRGGVRLLRLLLDRVLRPSLDLAVSPEEIEPKPKSALARSSGPAGTHALVPLVQRLGALMVWLVGIILVLDHFGQNVSSVVAAFGVTSLAIGLAAQQALSNIIAGLVLAVDHPFRPGDRIKLPSGDCGEVIESGMRSTHIRLADGSLLVVPNADLVSSRLINYSTETLVRAEVRVVVPVGTDVDKLSQAMLEEAAVLTRQDPPSVTPQVQLLSISEKVELSLILWLPRGSDVPVIEDMLRRGSLRHVQALLSPAIKPS